MARERTTARCINHPRTNGTANLLGVDLCNECARAALVYVLTKGGTLGEFAGNGLTDEPEQRQLSAPGAAPLLAPFDTGGADLPTS